MTSWLGEGARIRALTLGLALLATGCSLARSAGSEFASGAVDRISESDLPLIQLQRSLSDSAGVFLEQEFSEAVLLPARVTWAEMRQGVRDEGDSLALRLDDLLRSALTETLPSSLDRSATEVEGRLAGLGRAIAEEFMLALGEGVSEHLQPAADSLVVGVMRTAVSEIETELRPAMHALMLDLRDSLEVRIGDVDRAVAGTRTVSGFRYSLYGAGLVLVVVLLITMFGRWRQKSLALDALIEAIERGGHEGTKRAVQSCARDAGVESWLMKRVRQASGGMKRGVDAAARPGTAE